MLVIFILLSIARHQDLTLKLNYILEKERMFYENASSENFKYRVIHFMVQNVTRTYIEYLFYNIDFLLQSSNVLKIMYETLHHLNDLHAKCSKH